MESHATYRIVVKNQTTQSITLGELATINPGTGCAVAASEDILNADRLVIFASVGVLLDFPVLERQRFGIASTEFGVVLDHPDFGRIEVMIFDPKACELGVGTRGHAARTRPRNRRHLRSFRRAQRV